MRVINKSLATLIPAMRISIALAFLTVSILFSAEMFGFTPNQNKYLLDVRTKISESLALQFSVFDPVKDINKIQMLIRYIVKRNPDILSCGIRLDSGKLIFKSNNHEALWQGYNNYSNSSHVLVPIIFSGTLGGNVEIRYKELESLTLKGFFETPIFTTSAYVMLVGFFAYLVFMLRMLKQLDPSAVIPGRVNAAFDTMSEGVFIVDEDQQILLTNQVFSEKIGISIDALVGKKASSLQWESLSTQAANPPFPWVEVLKTGKSSVGTQIKLKSDNNEVYKFVLNASPIAGENDIARGVLVTLDDITEQEQRNTDLENTIVQLEETKLKVQEQNKELHYLATRDSLTGCLNRRSYGEQFEIAFDSARNNGSDLCCIMVDLDHFKRVNDNFGHAVGDEVIKLLAEVLQSNCRQDDLIARYGGEEFCVVLPNQTIETAFKVAERIRVGMEEESIKRFESGPHVTASVGVASILDEPDSPDQLNNMADEALYIAKSSGRNCVVTWSSKSKLSSSQI
jgi:diguanylate cyclase (GGDEF)-like protein/PAS domain S-box-containing protein